MTFGMVVWEVQTKRDVGSGLEIQTKLREVPYNIHRWQQ